MTHQYLLAHDLGTTGNKATLFDVTEGVVKVSTFEPYPTDYSQPGWAEQDPADWQRAIWQCTHRLISAGRHRPCVDCGGEFQRTHARRIAGGPAGHPLAELHYLG